VRYEFFDLGVDYYRNNPCPNAFSCTEKPFLIPSHKVSKLNIQEQSLKKYFSKLQTVLLDPQEYFVPQWAPVHIIINPSLFPSKRQWIFMTNYWLLKRILLHEVPSP
jgi:hypothetical protein